MMRWNQRVYLYYLETVIWTRHFHASHYEWHDQRKVAGKERRYQKRNYDLTRKNSEDDAMCEPNVLVRCAQKSDD
jgi:hypothetical protein